MVTCREDDNSGGIRDLRFRMRIHWRKKPKESPLTDCLTDRNRSTFTFLAFVSDRPDGCCDPPPKIPLRSSSAASYYATG